MRELALGSHACCVRRITRTSFGLSGRGGLRAWLAGSAVAVAWLASTPAAQAQTAAATNGPGDPPAQYPACSSVADEATTQAAQGAFQAGNASFNEADYPRAIFYWEDSYRRDCTAHAMLKNLARAYELNGQYEHAIRALETFLERNPETTEQEAIQRRIENLRQKLDERAKAAAAAAKPPPDKQPQPATQPRERNVLDEEEQFPEDTDRSSGRSVVPLVFAGVGVAVGGVGGALWYSALQEVKEAEEQCGGRVCDDSVSTRGNAAIDRQIRWAVVAGAGAALAVGGLIWYFAQPEDSASEEALRWSPALGVGFAGLDVQGAF